MYIQGRFVINAKYNQLEVKSAPRLIILIPNNYPEELPEVYETEGKIKNDHVMSNGGLCLATEFDLRTELCKSKSIEDYIDKFLIPFFISDYSWKTTGKYIFGDRSHGIEGIYQSISDYFKLKKNDRDFIKNLLRWSIKDKPFRLIFVDDNFRLKIRNIYSHKIGLFRKIGILNIKKIYKSLINLNELEKKYYEYLKIKNDNLNK